MTYTTDDHVTEKHYHSEPPFPTKHVVGYVISLALTLIALWLGLNNRMTENTVITIILIFAIAQIAVQLFFFMHVTERIGTRWHLWMLLLGFFFTFVIIAGSIWIMTFGGTGAY